MNGNLYCFPVFSLIRCGYHPRTSQPTLDPRELHASATAALRTPPCLFLYTGTRSYMYMYYYGEIRLNIRLPIKQLPASFARISSFPVSSLAFRLETCFVLLYRCTVRRERREPHKCTWRSQHYPLSGSIWLLWRRDKEEAQYLFTLFSALAKVIMIQYKQQVKVVDYTQYIKESVVPDEEDAVMSHSQ